MLVDAAKHGASDVGDEPLMLSRLAPVWVARDRAAAARLAVATGADCLVMDDGFQNPSLAKDLSLLVIDGAYGLGNGQVMPAGPLREPPLRALARADAVVLIGEDSFGLVHRITKPVLRAALQPVNVADFDGRRVVAFAGIGRPEKFFTTLEACGARVLARHGFPDHHAYSDADMRDLAKEAEAKAAILVTTTKDRARLAPAWRECIPALTVTIVWQDQAALLQLLDLVLRGD